MEMVEGGSEKFARKGGVGKMEGFVYGGLPSYIEIFFEIPRDAA